MVVDIGHELALVCRLGTKTAPASGPNKLPVFLTLDRRQRVGALAVELVGIHGVCVVL